jgi:hypothetical protein
MEMKEPTIKPEHLWFSRGLGFGGIILMILSINTPPIPGWVFYPGLLCTIFGFAFFLRKNAQVKDISEYKQMSDWRE